MFSVTLVLVCTLEW